MAASNAKRHVSGSPDAAASSASEPLPYLVPRLASPPVGTNAGILDPSKPLELSGIVVPFVGLCVVCKRPADTAFRANGQPGQPLLPLHPMCGMRLIVASRDYLSGRSVAWFEALGKPTPRPVTAGNLYAYPEFEGAGDEGLLSDLVLTWRCEHVNGKGRAHPKVTDAWLLDWIRTKACAVCEWTVTRCAPADPA